MDHLAITCYCYYYFPSHLLLFISSFTDALYAPLFVIVYSSYTYSTQSPNMALLSCLLRTLGIVIHYMSQHFSVAYFGLQLSDTCHSRIQLRRSVLHLHIFVPHYKRWSYQVLDSKIIHAQKNVPMIDHFVWLINKSVLIQIM